MAISSDPYGMTDAQANAIIARYAPNWRQWLHDGKTIDRILSVTSIVQVTQRCRRCSREARPGKKTCQVCADKHKGYNRAWYQST